MPPWKPANTNGSEFMPSVTVSTYIYISLSRREKDAGSKNSSFLETNIPHFDSKHPLKSLGSIAVNEVESLQTLRMESTPQSDDEFEGEEEVLFSPTSSTLLNNVELVLPRSKITLTNPQDSQVVTLLCFAVGDHNDVKTLIEEEEVCKMEVSKVIFESRQSNKRVLIFQCKTGSKTVCLKLMKNNRIYQMEKRAYEQMNEGQAALFLPVYFFCEVIMPDNCVWKGYCMQEGQYSLREILYTPPSDTFADIIAQRKIVETILNDKETQLRNPVMREEKNGGGEPVRFQEKQSIQMSLIMATMRLLHRMHKDHGWVHGDSHLGNFVYQKGKIYAIDFERSFATTHQVQHLLDLQECFGHFSGILLNPHGIHEWDMRDIFGIYYHRHPLLLTVTALPRGCVHMHSRRRTLFLLPICTCFTCPTQKLRQKGCVFCKSPLNEKSAHFVAEHFEDVMEDMRDWGITKMKNGLGQTRSTTVTRQCVALVDLIFPCIQDGVILVQKMGKRHPESLSDVAVPGKIRLAGDVDPGEPRIKRRKVLEIDQKTSVLSARIVMELTKSKQSCANALKRLLYMPIISLKAKAIMDEIIERLHYAGFGHAAKTLCSHVAQDVSLK